MDYEKEKIYDEEVLKENLEEIENMTVKEIRRGLREGYGFFIFGDSSWAILEADEAKRVIEWQKTYHSQEKIMDKYEKLYNEALERARQIKDGKDDWRYSDLAEITPALTYIFPQLRESEDEKVRKCLIAMVNTTIWDSSNLASKKACLAWLEKQKEQNKCPEFCSGHCVGCEQKEQKPAEWSEEDADILNCCISSIEEAKENRYAYKETDGDTSYDHEMKEQTMKEVEKPCHTVEEWMEHIKNADELTKAIFSKGPYDVLYDALNHPYQHCYDAIKEFGELCYQTARQDMMKEAVDAKFISMDEGIIKYSPLFTRKLKQIFRLCDKVRIIIVKED